MLGPHRLLGAVCSRRGDEIARQTQQDAKPSEHLRAVEILLLDSVETDALLLLGQLGDIAGVEREAPAPRL